MSGKRDRAEISRIVNGVIADAASGSSATIDDLTSRLSGVSDKRSLISDLASKNPALLGTGVVS
jgi:hypothetical protein